MFFFFYLADNWNLSFTNTAKLLKRKSQQTYLAVYHLSDRLTTTRGLASA